MSTKYMAFRTEANAAPDLVMRATMVAQEHAEGSFGVRPVFQRSDESTDDFDLWVAQFEVSDG